MGARWINLPEVKTPPNLKGGISPHLTIYCVMLMLNLYELVSGLSMGIIYIPHRQEGYEGETKENK